MQKKNVIRSETKAKRTVGKREKRRLTQLGLCIFLFCVVMLGKGLAPGEMRQTSERLLQYIRTDTDFRTMFSSLGHSFDMNDSMWERIKDAAVETFAGEEEASDADSVNIPFVAGPAVQIAAVRLKELPSYQSMLIQLAPAYGFEE